MAETTIEWTATRLPNGTTLPGYTFNPWEGCQKVGPGCDNCYAEARNMRFAAGANWGPHAPRRLTSAANWRKPIKWDAEARRTNIRRNVFCASLADVMDNHDSIPAQWRDDLAAMITGTPNLNWLLLTKRIGNARHMLRQMFPAGVPPNLWLGATVVNQTEADRDIPRLLQVKAALGISVAFLSVEPMLGAIDLSHWMGVHHSRDNNMADPETRDAVNTMIRLAREQFRAEHGNNGIDWVICGGESGPNARPMHPDWARSLRDQCEAAVVPFLFKQWGEWVGASHLPGVTGVATAPPTGSNHAHPHRRRIHGGELDGQCFQGILGNHEMVRVGKACAGRLLDGREWNQMPGVL